MIPYVSAEYQRELPALKDVKTATEVGVRAIQDHKVIEWNTYWKCRLSEGTDNI